ncbi:hypothetical protein D9M68_916970 [compost metagenome]
MVGHALRVVARAHGDHAARPFVGAQLRELVAGTALLERGGVLQVLEFQEHLAAGELRDGARFDEGGVQHLPGQAGGGGLNVFEFQHRAIVNWRAGPRATLKPDKSHKHGSSLSSMIHQAGLWSI